MSEASSPSSSLDAQLIAATRDGKGFDECKALIDKGARVNAMNSNRNTALHYASRYGQDPLAKLLLEQGAHPNVKNTNGWTPLHEAATAGQFSLTKLLLQHKADCNSKGMHGYTPLHDAAIKGHKAVVYLLLDHGANTMAKNNEGKTVHDVASRGLTSIDLHLYKALQPTRSAIAKLTSISHENQQELLALKDVMARQRKADFDILRRETYQVQQSLQQLLAQQAAKHEQQLQAQRKELLSMMMRNGGGGISITTTMQQQQEEEHENPAASSSSFNEYNASAKSSTSTSLEERSLEKSPSMTTVSTATSTSSSGSAGSAGVVAAGNNNNDTTALALQRLVLQRNNDMTTLRREITGTQESLAKMLREQVEEKVKATMIKMPEIASLRQEQERQAKVLENITSSANTNINNNAVDNGSNGSSDFRQVVEALRNEFITNKENVLTEMTNLKKEIKLVQKTSDNNAIQARSRTLSSESVGGGGDAVEDNDTHLKQLQRKKSEKEEAAISAMRDAFMSKHQADLETVRAEIVAAEEHLIGLIQQQTSSSSSNNKSRSTSETANQEQDDMTFQGEEGDCVTQKELKKLLHKKTQKQEASLAELREEFTKLMEFLEHADVGSLRDDMMELVTSQVEQQNAAVAELREAITTDHQPKHQKAATQGLPPIHDDEDEEDEDDDEEEEEEDDGSLEELKKTVEAQGEAQRKALTALGEKLSLQRKQDMTALREETASTREHLENQMQQQAEQQETRIAALRDEMSTGVVSSASKQQGDTTLDGIRDEIKEMEDSLKGLIQNQSKKQDAALAALQTKLAMKETEGKSATSDEASLKLIQKQQDEIKAQHQADISTLKKAIHATRASLKKLSEQQQKSNQTSAMQESRKVESAGNNDNKAYKDLEAAITMLQNDMSASNEKLNRLSAENEGKSVPASPLQTGRPKWSAKSLLSPISIKPPINTAREGVNGDEDKSVAASPVQKGRPKWSPRSPRSTRQVENEQGTSSPSYESLKLIQKQQEELQAQQQADIANLRKEISSTKESLKKAEGQGDKLASLQKDIEATKERLKEITEQQQQNGMAALEEKFIAKENVKSIIQQSLSEQDSQREAQMKSLLRTQEELDELILSLEELGGNSSSKQKDAGDMEQEDQLRTDIADLRAMVSNYLLALKETMEEIAALREQVDVKLPDEVGESDDASSKDSEMLEELNRMFDGQSEGSPNEEEVSLQEELRKVTAELKMVQAVADRYKETVMKLHQISEQALS